jgi:hypothetical protein
LINKKGLKNTLDFTRKYRLEYINSLPYTNIHYFILWQGLISFFILRGLHGFSSQFHLLTLASSYVFLVGHGVALINQSHGEKYNFTRSKKRWHLKKSCTIINNSIMQSWYFPMAMVYHDFFYTKYPVFHDMYRNELKKYKYNLNKLIISIKYYSCLIWV